MGVGVGVGQWCSRMCWVMFSGDFECVRARVSGDFECVRVRARVSGALECAGLCSVVISNVLGLGLGLGSGPLI